MFRHTIFLITRTLLLAVLLVSVTIPGHSVIKSNGSGGTYGDDNDGETTDKRAVGPVGIEHYIIEGAGYSIASNIYIQKMLHCIEIHGNVGMDGETFRVDLNNAIINLKLAIDTYELLNWSANVTPYNPIVLEKLEKFDYKGYCWRNNLTYSVWSTVEYYLIRGQVTEIYLRTRNKMKELLDLLLHIENELTAGRYPTVDYFWKINEMSAEEALFGSYVARIFKAIN